MGGSWLDGGHGDGESLAPVTGVPARDIVDSSDRGAASWNSRSSKALVAALVAVALIGSTGTAYAVRETLFPSLGAPTSPSVWSNTPPAEEPAEVTVAREASSTSTVPVVPPVTSVPVDTSPAPESVTVTSVEDHTRAVESQGSGSRTSGRRGSGPSRVVPEIDDSGSEQHATPTKPVSHTSPSPESAPGSVPTTDGSGSGRGSSASTSESGGVTTTQAPAPSSSGSSGAGSGSSDPSDNSGSGQSGNDDDQSDSDDQSDDDDRTRDDRSSDD